MASGRRPNITRIVRAVIRDVAKQLPEFAHIEASRILVVAGEARRASWATIRPLGPAGSTDRPVVRIKGRQMLYVIALRPRFFRSATPEKRVETIVHELFHISRRFDGTLHRGRLHSRLGASFDARLGPLVHRYLEMMAPELREAMSFHGLVNARQWLEKPGLTVKRRTASSRSRGRRIYTEKQLFLGPVEMITRSPRRGLH
jgi:predicted metallopeptidase